jgi:hypothetical protein
VGCTQIKEEGMKAFYKNGNTRDLARRLAAIIRTVKREDFYPVVEYVWPNSQIDVRLRGKDYVITIEEVHET